MLVDKITDILEQFVSFSDWRFAIGVRIRYNNPTLIFQTYPNVWLKYYDEEALLLQDPTVIWGMTNTGIIDWEDLKSVDFNGVLKKAEPYGLKYGIAISVGTSSQRTLGFITSATDTFDEENKIWALKQIEKLHNITDGIVEAPEQELTVLRNINCELAKYRDGG